MKKGSKILVSLFAVALLLCLATLTLVACDGLLGGKDGTTPGGNPESEIEMTPVEEFEFAQLEDGAYEIKKYTGDRTKIKIPSEYDGQAITGIGDEAFRDCTGIQAVVVPDSVTSIGDDAFYGCTGLSEITIPDSVTSIGLGAFSHCDKLVHIRNLSDVEFSSPAKIGVEVLTTKDAEFQNKIEKDDNGIWTYTVGNTVYAFGYEGTDTNLDLSLNSNINAIYPSAFFYYSNITSITIPDSITSIPEGAFAYCQNLQTVTIGTGVTSIGGSAFSGCEGLSEITIPDSVQSIGDGAFAGCIRLSEIIIPDSVTSIGEDAFGTCIGLQTVTIGEGLQSIGDYAFHDCTGLKYIFYVGNETQWGQITKGYKWDQYFTHSTNGRLECYTIEYQLHYNSTGPEA